LFLGTFLPFYLPAHLFPYKMTLLKAWELRMLLCPFIVPPSS
jgi:hypothetical protein